MNALTTYGFPRQKKKKKLRLCEELQPHKCLPTWRHAVPSHQVFVALRFPGFGTFSKLGGIYSFQCLFITTRGGVDVPFVYKRIS